MTRSLLRFAKRPHIVRGYPGGPFVEVVRDGEVVATIYGTREGVQIVSEAFGTNGERLSPFGMAVDVPNSGRIASVIVPLLRTDEECPWCKDDKLIDLGNGPVVCPACKGRDAA